MLFSQILCLYFAYHNCTCNNTGNGQLTWEAHLTLFDAECLYNCDCCYSGLI